MFTGRIIPGLAVALLLVGATMALAQTTVEVQMTSGLTFDPPVVTLNVGDTVRWINTSSGGLRHTATAERRRDRKAGFNSGTRPSHWLRPGESFEFTFTMPGEFPYFCIPHRAFGMVGTVIVNEASTPTSQLFTASAEEGKVVLRWRVNGKSGRLGFHVLRSTGWGEEFVQVTDTLVPVQGDLRGESEYTFTDAGVVPGTRYYYVVEDVSGQGPASFRGPAVVVTR